MSMGIGYLATAEANQVAAFDAAVKEALSVRCSTLSLPMLCESRHLTLLALTREEQLRL